MQNKTGTRAGRRSDSVNDPKTNRSVVRYWARKNSALNLRLIHFNIKTGENEQSERKEKWTETRKVTKTGVISFSFEWTLNWTPSSLTLYRLDVFDVFLFCQRKRRNSNWIHKDLVFNWKWNLPGNWSKKSSEIVWELGRVLQDRRLYEVWDYPLGLI